MLHRDPEGPTAGRRRRGGRRAPGRPPLGTLALWLPAAVLGCAAPAERTESPRVDTAVIASATDVHGVNELLHRRTAAQTAVLLGGLFLPLLEEQSDYREGLPGFAPRLAESYAFSDDRLELTFRLRPEARWSDGAPITAEDVRFTFEAQTHPAVAWVYASAKARITGVEAVDAHTVRFRFREPYAAQLLDANEGVILPRHAWGRRSFDQWRDDPGWFDRHPVTSGPFVLEGWQPGERLVLGRNEHYHEPGLPRLERVVFEVVPDPAGRLSLLRSGRADVVEIEVSDLPQVVADPELELISYRPRQLVFLSWNLARFPFDDGRVRRALTLGIDRWQIVEATYGEHASVGASPYPAGTWANDPSLEPWPYDPAAARELLAEAGWRDLDGDGVVEKDGRALRFELLTNGDNRLRRDIQVMVRDQLGRIGVDAVPRAIEFNTLGSRLYAHDFDAALNSVGFDTSFSLYHLFHSEAVDSLNWGAYSDPEVDRLIERLDATVDPLAARELHHRLQRLIHRDQPVTFLYEPRRLVAVHERLRGVRPSALSTFLYLREWWLAEPAEAP